MFTTSDSTLLMIFGPLNNISVDHDHKELQTVLLNAVNCNEVPGPKVGQNKLNPKFITIPSSGRPVNAIALNISRRKKTTLSKFERRLPLLVHIETGDLLDDFKRALEYQNLWVLGCIPIITLPWHTEIGSFSGLMESLRISCKYLDTVPTKLNSSLWISSGIQSLDSHQPHLSHDGTKLKCSMLKDGPSLLPASTLAPTPASTSPTSPGFPINPTYLAGPSGALGAIPIYALNLQSAEEVAAFMRSEQIQTEMRQYGGIQVWQTPPIPGWDGAEETIERVKQFLNDSPHFGPHGQ